MQLSEAMRLGAMSCRQGFSDFFEFDLTGEPRAACALGAALIAVGRTDMVDEQCHNWEVWDKVFDVRFRRRTDCPGVHCTMHGNAYEAIVHLNDDHHWTREQIATWVAEVEKGYEANQPVQTEVRDARHAASCTASG